VSDFAFFFEAFHLMRPFWLLLVPLVLLVWWWIRERAKPETITNDGLAPHLRDALMLGSRSLRRFQPVDGVCMVLLFSVIGAAGPTWSRVPDPFMAQTAPLVIVLKVTDSMDSDDVKPSRLERGKQKIRDLLELRAGARTGLVVYSGTAHRVVPLTEDAKIMLPYLEGISTDLMPQEGSNAGAAFRIAQDILASQDQPGGVLFILDSLETPGVDVAPQSDQVSTAFLSMLPDGVRDRGLDQITDAPVVSVTADGSDVRQLDRILNAAYRRALLDDESQQWNDRGWLLAWPAAFLTLLWFRRGWTMQWGMVLLVMASVSAPSAVRADGMRDWFLTPDQQGRLAYDRKDYVAAAELFTDPLWRGYALFRAGSYEEAAEVLRTVETAQAEFIRAIALIRNRNYRDGVRAFETVLERDPSYPNAAENLEVARAIVVYVETAQEQSDTGETSGIGADEIVFDNESGRGADTQIEEPEETGIEMLSTDQWMNTVNTNAADFLRLRFLLEANNQP
jgi:Ca-activated chloride channel family protein